MGLMENEKDEANWVVEPEDIRADKQTIASLCLQQINRLNYLTSLGLSGCEPEKMSQMASGILIGLAALETMLMPELSEEYKQKVIPIKEKLFAPIKKRGNEISGQIFVWETAPFYAVIKAMEWYNLLTQEASKTNLYPTKEMGWEAGVGPFDRTTARSH